MELRCTLQKFDFDHTQPQVPRLTNSFLRAPEVLGLSKSTVKDFQNKLTEFLGTQHDSILKAIRDKGAIDDASAANLKKVIGSFAESYQG